MAGVISETVLREVGDALADSLRKLIAKDDGGAPRPTDLLRSWRLDQTLCIRLCGALRNEDPLAVLHELPAPPSLKALATAAKKAGVAKERRAEAAKQIGVLEDLIRRFGGKKSNLDTFVGSRLVGAREKTEQRSKQSIFRGMANLLGLQTEVAMTTYFVVPSEEPGFCDELAMYGSIGLRRLRPELRILVGGRVLQHPPEEGGVDPEARMHGGSLEDDGYSVAMKEFSSSPFPKVELIRDGQKLLYTLPGDEEGSYEELDLFFASIDTQASRRHRDDETAQAIFGFVPRNPSKNLLVDVFVHDDVWQGIEPRLDMARSDSTLATDSPAAPISRFDFCESLQSLGRADAARGVSFLPRYGEMLDWVYEARDWRRDDFRLYRLAVKHPVIGFRYTIVFDLESSS